MVTVTRAELPRVAIAGLGGDTGKSLVALGLARALGRRRLRVAPFKKGPDFIDAAWLGAAAGTTCHNLDTFMMPATAVRASIGRAAGSADIAVIEGNRGLFDGMNAEGSHSTAELAKLIATPVILVVDATKVTRTVAALVLGCQAMDPEVRLAGVILNRVGSRRQVEVIRQALVKTTGLRVLGAIPRLEEQHLPSRHLGLVTASEHPDRERALDRVADLIEEHIDIEAVTQIATTAGPLPDFESELFSRQEPAPNLRARIGILRDEAFSFYYPDNLEALAAAGAELVEISPLADRGLPEIDGLYAGGGFPEEYAGRLADNEPLRRALAEKMADGLVVWAECGGLMYLARAVRLGGATYPMVGAIPVNVEQTPRPQGHGYVSARVDGENPVLPRGTTLCGHEFHYSRLEAGEAALDTVLALDRGVGLGQSRDGIRVSNIVATYTHLHALGVPTWAPGFVRAARQHATGAAE